MRATQVMVLFLVMTRVVALNAKRMSCSTGRTFIITEGKLEQTLACESRDKASKEKMEGGVNSVRERELGRESGGGREQLK